VYVQMPDPWRYVERACPEHWPIIPKPEAARH
jgi:hypothetical protein